MKIIWATKPPGRRSNLTEKQIDLIRNSGLPGTVLAKRFGISEARVSQIRNKPWQRSPRYANDNRFG